MTENEAIELLRSMQNPKQDYADVVCAPAFCTGFRFVYPEPEDYAIEEAIKALKEIQQYREIGTVEECRKAVEKQKPKKILPLTNGLLFDDGWRHKCPNCGCAVGENIYHPDVTKDYEYCSMCGQAIHE